MDYSRRNFLKTAGAVAIGVAAAPLVAHANQRLEENPNHIGVLTDTTLCIGLNCRRCEIACAKENGLPPIEKAPEDESVFHSVRRPHAGQFTVVNRFHDDKRDKPQYVKRQCLHCEEPACASACFVKALRKTPEGPVTYNADVCVGCRYCMTACPFSIPAYEYFEPLTPRVRKCTMCYKTRTSKGLRPACVEACPNDVMTFGKRSDLIALAHQKIAQSPDRYVPQVYGENEIGGTSWMFLSGIPFEKIDLPTDLGVTPLPEYPRNYLSAAPLILAMWPAFFGGMYLLTKRRDELMKHDADKTVDAETERPEEK